MGNLPKFTMPVCDTHVRAGSYHPVRRGYHNIKSVKVFNECYKVKCLNLNCHLFIALDAYFMHHCNKGYQATQVGSGGIEAMYNITVV